MDSRLQVIDEEEGIMDEVEIKNDKGIFIDLDEKVSPSSTVQAVQSVQGIHSVHYNTAQGIHHENKFREELETFPSGNHVIQINASNASNASNIKDYSINSQGVTRQHTPIKRSSHIDNNHRVEDLISDCDLKCERSRKYAHIYKVMNVLFSITIIICGVLVTAQGFLNPTVDYIQVGLGIIISSCKTIVSAFSLRERGLIHKTVSVKFKKLSRKLDNLLILAAPEMDVNNAIMRAYQEFDELDICLYIGEGKKIGNSQESPVRVLP